MKKRKILPILILIGFIILGIIFLKRHTHELVRILDVDLRYVAIIAVLVVLQSLLRGYKSKILMDIYGIKLKFKEWWGLEIMTEAGNNIIPFKGGTSVRAVYFKKKYQFPYTFFASMTGLSYLIDFLGLGVLGVLVSFFLNVQNEIKYSLLIFFMIISLVSSFILFFIPLPLNVNIRILKHVATSINELRCIRTKYFALFGLSLNFLLRCFATVTRLYLCFLAFGLSLSFYSCFVMGLFIGVSNVISITPMNLGFRESIIIVSAKLFSISPLLGAFVAILDRVIASLLVFITAPTISYLLLNDFKTKKNIKLQAQKR